MRWLSALASYLTEPTNHNLLGVRVSNEHEPKSLWKHLARKPVEYDPTPPLPPIEHEPEPKPEPRIVFINHQPAPKAKKQKKKPAPVPINRMQLLEQIENDYREDLYIVEQMDDPTTKRAALVQAQKKRRKRIARLIGER